MDDPGARLAFAFHLGAEKFRRLKETLERQILTCPPGKMILGFEPVEFPLLTFPASGGELPREPEPCRACLVFQEKKVAQQCPACQMREETQIT